jgi:hypothetical protein
MLGSIETKPYALQIWQFWINLLCIDLILILSKSDGNVACCDATCFDSREKGERVFGLSKGLRLMITVCVADTIFGYPKEMRHIRTT